MKLAKFRCWRCSYEWEDRPGSTDSLNIDDQGRPLPRTCRRCGHLYMAWLNYEEDFEKKKGR